MSVTSSDFLISAQAHATGGDEMSHRNCISRAYYSVYHAAYPVAIAHLPDPNKNFFMGEHERLSKRYRASSNATAKSIGYMLENMKAARHRADYDLGDTVSQSDATQVLANARRFAQQLAAFEQSVAKPDSGSGVSDQDGHRN